MVSAVPPPVPPRTGLTPVMSAVFDASYVYPPVRVFVTPFSVTDTSQTEVTATGAGEDKGIIEVRGNDTIMVIKYVWQMNFFLVHIKTNLHGTYMRKSK